MMSANLNSGRPCWRVPKNSPGPRSEVLLGDLEAVGGLGHGLEAALGLVGGGLADEEAERLVLAAADAAAKLVELRPGRSARRSRRP